MADIDSHLLKASLQGKATKSSRSTLAALMDKAVEQALSADPLIANDENELVDTALFLIDSKAVSLECANDGDDDEHPKQESIS